MVKVIDIPDNIAVLKTMMVVVVANPIVLSFLRWSKTNVFSKRKVSIIEINVIIPSQVEYNPNALGAKILVIINDATTGINCAIIEPANTVVIAPDILNILKFLIVNKILWCSSSIYLFKERSYFFYNYLACFAVSVNFIGL